MSSLQVPLGIRVPEVRVDLAAITEALSRFEQFGNQDPSLPVNRHDLVLVGKYLLNWYNKDDVNTNECNPQYWNLVLQDGLPGYTLFIHEASELQWYFDNFDEKKLDPFLKDLRPGSGTVDQIMGYDPAHARALLKEHRYLQGVSRDEGFQFTLRELVVANPHGVGNEDWILLSEQLPDQLSETDRANDPRRLEKAEDWYEKYGYRGVSDPL